MKFASPMPLRLGTTLVSISMAATIAHADPAGRSTATKEKQQASITKQQPSREMIDLDAYTRIREEGFKRGKVMEFAEALTDGIGPRLTGSPNMAKANSWTKDTLTSIGLSNAHLEDWGEFGMGWQQMNAWGRLASPDSGPLWMQAAPWSPSTNGPVTAELVYMPLKDMEEVASFKGKLAGKIVLLGGPREIPESLAPIFKRYTDRELLEMMTYDPESGGWPPEFRPLLAQLKQTLVMRLKAMKVLTEERPLAVIVGTRDGVGFNGSGLIFDDNTMVLTKDGQEPENAVKFPYAVMMAEQYNRLARMASRHVPIQLEIDIDTKFTGDHEHGFNTIAEIPGSDPLLKNQVVMVGGHLDSWISGTGATDNGAGVAVAMESVRILKALNLNPRRTIRIALWSGEEQGEYGSTGYVKAHYGGFEELPPPAGSPKGTASLQGRFVPKKDWETLDAYYNLDNGSGKIRGIYTQQNFTIAPIFSQWIAPLQHLGVTTVTTRNTGSTDHEPFDEVGLPGFQYIQDPLDYETRTHHSNLDTYDHLREADLEQAAVVQAIFLWNTSQREAMMPRKLLPNPELERRRSLPLVDIYPNAPKTSPEKPKGN